MSEISCAHRHLQSMIEREENAEEALRRAESYLIGARADRDRAEQDYEALVCSGEG